MGLETVAIAAVGQVAGMGLSKMFGGGRMPPPPPMAQQQIIVPGSDPASHKPISVRPPIQVKGETPTNQERSQQIKALISGGEGVAMQPLGSIGRGMTGRKTLLGQ